MKSDAQSRLLTVEDLYTLPDDGKRYQLQAGVLLSEPLPGTRHGVVMARIARLLGDFVEKRGLGFILAGDAGFILARSPDTVLGPDIAFVARERFAKVEDLSRAFPGAPDLAVEISSPGDRPADVHAKVADYLAGGTRLVWVVDPERRHVTVYRSLLLPRVAGLKDRLDGEDVLPGYDVAVSALFEI